MKIRSDFVTNSSSSSYVIAYRKNIDIDEDTKKKHPFVKLYDRLIQSIIDSVDYCDTEEATVYETREDYDRYFLEGNSYYGSSVDEILKNNEYARDEYEEVCKYFADGYSVMRKRVGDHNNGLIDMIKTMSEDNDDFIVLSGDEY